MVPRISQIGICLTSLLFSLAASDYIHHGGFPNLGLHDPITEMFFGGGDEKEAAFYGKPEILIDSLQPYLPGDKEFTLKEAPEQYVISVGTIHGERLTGVEQGDNNTCMVHIQEPQQHNLPEPCEIWVFELVIVNGKKFYNIKNVQLGMYLQASPTIFETYYHQCVLAQKAEDDTSFLWEITPLDWKIRNYYYDEYLIPPPSNETQIAMTHPKPEPEIEDHWLITRKSDIFAVRPQKMKYRG